VNRLLDIRLQKLFLVTLVVKLGFSFCGWYLQMPWSLGFCFPLLIMVAYILLGYHRRDLDVNDDKFADSCYYLGFIFTFTSIIFCLFDLPNIGTKIQDIAVRFGAAMVSTVLGLSVRVYMVTFRRDFNHAIKDAEDALLDATQRLTERFAIALERLHRFELQVDDAAQSTMERVKLNVESVSKTHAENIAVLYADVTVRNRQVANASVAELHAASKRLAGYVDDYSMGMRANLTSIEAKVTEFAEALTARLRATTFPDDYFAQQLHAPLAQMKESAETLSTSVKVVSSAVSGGAATLAIALQKLQKYSHAAGGSLETVINLTLQQQRLLEVSQGDLTALGLVTTTLQRLEHALASSTDGLAQGRTVATELMSQVSVLVAENTGIRESLDKALNTVVEELEKNATFISKVAENVEGSAAAAAAAAAVVVEHINTTTTPRNRRIPEVDMNLGSRPQQSIDSLPSQSSIMSSGLVGQET
jgi:cell division protein FtsB